MSLKRLLSLPLLLIVLSGCGQGTRMASAPGREAPAAAAAKRSLALEHSVTIDTSEERIPSVFRLAQDACAKAAAEQCAVLEANLTGGRYPAARLKLRAMPAGIRAVLASLAGSGGVVAQSTRAEDLGEPIQDSARQLAMLNSYRTKLEALAARPNLDADALIKLHRELAQVQSQLEAQTNVQANLHRRVDTELLQIEIGAEGQRAFGPPIRDALARFGSSLSEGIAGTISGIAYFAPLALLLAIVAAIVRKLRARRAGKRA